MADTKLRNLTVTTTPALTDLTYTVEDPAGLANSRKATLGDILAVGGGGLTLLESHTASGGATLAFGTRNAPGKSGATFQSDFDTYVIKFRNICPSTTTVHLAFQFSTDGGSTWLTSYRWSYLYMHDSGGEGVNTQNTGGTWGTSGIEMSNSQTNTSSEGNSGSITVSNPLSTTSVRAFSYESSYLYSTFRHAFMGTAWYTTTGTAINTIQFLFSSGNVASGTAFCYGVQK